MASETPVVDAPSGKPQQDPTALTTEKVQREIDQTIALLRAELNGEIRRIEARLDAMDKALQLVEKFPTELDHKIIAQERLFQVEIDTINKLLDERYKNRKQWEEATVKAVDTAFQAAKELLGEQRYAGEKAVEKSEKAIKTELEAQRAITTDLKERLMAQELSLTNRIGAIENKSTGASNLWALIVSSIVVTGIFAAGLTTIVTMSMSIE